MHHDDTVNPSAGEDEEMEYGATIERGRVAALAEGGYTVASLDRDGIESPVLTGIDDTAYTVGDTVYFFLFRDGTGKIICKA